MSPFRALCEREVRAALTSPGSWLLLAGYQLIAGLVFLLTLVNGQTTDLAGLYFDVGVLFLFLAPMLTASAFGADWRDGTMELLLTSALSSRQIVLAKFAGAASILAMATVLSAQFPIWTALFGEVDGAASACALAGCLLLGLTLAAIGTLSAAVTRSTAASAVVAFCFGMGFWFLHSLGLAFGVDEGGPTDRFSFYLRFGPMTRGIADTGDIAFFVLATVAFLAIASATLSAERSARD